MGGEGIRDFVMAWLPAPPAAVLDAGCGDGRLTIELRELGYDASGLDPRAPEGEGFIRGTLEELEEREAFDAAVAVYSLHHLNDAPLAVERLAASIRPGGRLIVAEFAREDCGRQAEAWFERHRLDSMPGGRGHGHHLLELADLRRLLEERLTELHAERVPYLSIENKRPDLLDAEAEAITAGELPAIGARLVYERP